MKRVLIRLIGLFALLIGVMAVLAVFLTSDTPIWGRPNQIGIIEIKGTISESEDILKALKKFRKSGNIRAILLRIDSPGGEVGSSQELYHEVRRTIDSKPVVASLGGVAASGGYYAAAASTQIIANPGTLTGSIGAIISFKNLQRLFDKIGYGNVVVKSGEFKDLGNPAREMTPQEKKLLQETIDGIHRQFVRDIALGRSLPEEKVREIADGRILTGEVACQLGLVDELGNFEDAVNAACTLGKITGEPKLVYADVKKRSLADLILGTSVMDRVRALLDESYNSLSYGVVR